MRSTAILMAGTTTKPQAWINGVIALYNGLDEKYTKEGKYHYTTLSLINWEAVVNDRRG